MTTAVRAAPGGTEAGPPDRGARRALLPLGIMVAGIALALGLQALFDPFRTHIPLCLMNHLTGLHCPGCGASRAVHALLDGDLLLALRNNAVIVLAAPPIAAGMVLWTVRRVRGLRTDLWPSRPVVLVLLAVVLAYTVARNLPVLRFLAPTTLVGA